MTRHIQSHSIVRILGKHFQEYLGIFRIIDAYSSTLTGMQLGKEGAGLPYSFWEIKKNVLILEKKAMIAHLWVKFSIQNVVV